MADPEGSHSALRSRETYSRAWSSMGSGRFAGRHTTFASVVSVSDPPSPPISPCSLGPRACLIGNMPPMAPDHEVRGFERMPSTRAHCRSQHRGTSPTLFDGMEMLISNLCISTV